MTIGDANGNGTDLLMITLSGAGTLADGAGFSHLVTISRGVYTLFGTAAAVTSELDALVFTPIAGVPGTFVTTTFRLSDKSSAYATPTVDSTTSVIDSIWPPRRPSQRSSVSMAPTAKPRMQV